MRELTLALNPGQREPLYEQLVRAIATEIRAGRMVAGEKLPGVRALCAYLSVSRSTVEAAYQILAAEGYIEARERSGCYVRAYEPPMESACEPPRPRRAAEPERYRYRFSTADVEVGEFPYRAWAKLYKGVVQHGSALLLRGHPQGDEPLRAALADFLRQHRAVHCGADQLVIGAGVDHLLGMLLVLLGPGAIYALEDPGYPASYHTLNNSGRRCAMVPLDDWGMDVDALAKSGANVAYVTPSHQFPTGATMPAGRRAKLLSWAAQGAGRYIIEDDYDSEFRHTTRPIPAMQGMDPQRVIYIGTFNRSIAPAVRVAYMALPPALLDRFEAACAHAPCAVSRFEQRALAAFLAEGHYQRHLRRMANLYRRRRDALIEALSAIEGARLSGHEAGLHCLLTHDRLSESELIARAKGAGALVHGLSEYARARACAANTLVLGYGGMGEGDIRAAAEALREAWK